MTSTTLTDTLRILEPAPGIFAYYDGRIPGKRLHSPERNWLDDGAYSLGIASYAIVCGRQALVYDTHISLDHARFIRAHLAAIGVSDIEVVLSHWHTDHIAGNAVYSDCMIIANPQTALAMVENDRLLAQKSPPIHPLVLPNRLFDGRLSIAYGTRRIELLQFNIHSADGTVVWLPGEGLLLAGDTLEDTITYVSEPENIGVHIQELGRLSELPIRRILPNHGADDRIAGGGYDVGLIEANRRYLHRLSRQIDEPDLPERPLSAFLWEELSEGWISYFEPYERVHRDNIAAHRGARTRQGVDNNKSENIPPNA
ncbi:MBL fold metallo-hydrolase [Allorhizobium pseudoryzae]|uniref:MBL fold metallo-hydrolase n=1 Tax=Allorhizobium pseudoryzae TaxID=379684 RepID=UPI003D02C4B8